jgi:hypothetical protein
MDIDGVIDFLLDIFDADVLRELLPADYIERLDRAAERENERREYERSIGINE